MNFPKIAEQVIEKLGGKNNIATAAHCATRLRIVLNDESKVDKEGIEAIEGVKGQFSVAGQYQIIFGSEFTTTDSKRFSRYFCPNYSSYRCRRSINGTLFNANLYRFLLG